jgi:hypothetical protein
MVGSEKKGGLAAIAAVAARAALALCLAGEPALAHHSFASYEADHQIAFTGKVTSFQWANPHVYIEMDAPDESGAMKHWLIECANPGILNRVGWKWNMIKEGDEISVIVAPLRNGEPGALLKAVRLADGSRYDNGGPAGPATIPFE